MRKKNAVEKDVDYLCGIGQWRPQWLQALAGPKMFLVNMGLIGIVQGGSYIYFMASLSTLEKRYAWSSTYSGIILIADNIPELFGGPVFGLLANRMHRPRLLGFSQLIVGLGCFVAALPYFIYGAADPNQVSATGQQSKAAEYCDANKNLDASCAQSSSNTVWTAFAFVCTACLLNGFGSAVYWCIGFSHIDDSVKKKNSPTYMSTASAFRVLGPTIAFSLSSMVLQFYENPMIDPGITTKDPRWVGAWWIGFITLGVAIWLCALPMFFYPRHFKKLTVKNEVAKKLAIKDDSAKAKLLRLVKNPIYVCYILGTNFRFLGVLGYMTFKAKYIESMYRQSASAANLLTGAVGVLPMATGILLSGVIIQYFKPGPRRLTTFITIVEVIGCTGFLAAMFLGCPVAEYAGQSNDGQVNMMATCNQDCSCTQQSYTPVCGPDLKTNYFSPCFAGCAKSSLNTTDDKQYIGCSCLSGTATAGYCPADCGYNMWYYALLLTAAGLVSRLATAGNSIIAFRIVEPEDKAFSAGLAVGFMNIFAFIPYPLLYGAVTDSACLIWEERCGHRGNCWVYDSQKFKNRLHGLTIGLYLLGSLFDCIVIVLSHRIQNLYSDPEDEVDKEDDGFDAIDL